MAEHAGIAELKTKLGADKLVLTRFSGSEGMSRLFEFTVEGVAKDDGNINFDPQLGQNVTVTLHTQGQGDRYFTGTCVAARRMGRLGEGFHYAMTLRPSLWLLSRRVNSRVFHDKKAPDVIKEVLQDYGGVVETPEDNTKGPHPEMEYCVQHNESDLDFVLRLMEAAGISYHFKFGDDTQKLVLCDSESVYEAVPGAKRSYFDEAHYINREEEHLYSWSPQRRFTTNKAALTDYKLQQPGDNNLGDFDGDAGFNPKLEDYRHPFPQHLGKNTSPDFGKSYAEVRVLAERGEDGIFDAAGDCGSFTPGYTVTVEKHPSDNGEYLVVNASHTIEVELLRSGDGEGGLDMPYRGEYELMKKARFVPPIITPKPIVGGPQTGKVVGDNTKGTNNEIYTDKFGRIKVHLHWNRKDEGKAEGQTMWCRVAHVWAGPEAGWGAIFIPRVGMEVLVAFLDGDPDRPIVTGCVYHQDNMPPYTLPAEAFTAGWKSRSETGNGYNELIFRDKTDNELIRVHAQKDLSTTVENKEDRLVKVDRDTKINKNDTLWVGDTLDVTAIKMIKLTVGRSKITMEPDAITIESTQVTVKATGKLTTQAGGIAEHKAGATLIIQGGLVTIN